VQCQGAIDKQPLSLGDSRKAIRGILNGSNEVTVVEGIRPTKIDKKRVGRLSGLKR